MTIEDTVIETMGVVVNVTIGGEAWMARGRERLEHSLDVYSPVERRIFTKWSDLGGPTHDEAPYAFKYTALTKLALEGFQYPIWLDASMFAIESLWPIFYYIREHGYWLEENPHNFRIGQYASDACLNAMGVTRDEAMEIPKVVSGAFGIGGMPEGCELLAKMYEHSRDGVTFPGPWDNAGQKASKDPRCKGHRHDQTVLSILAWKMGLKILPPGRGFICWGSWERAPKHQCLAYRRNA